VYDNITPEQWIYGLLASVIVFGVMAWLFYRYTHPRDEAHNMSSAPAQPAAAAGTQVVHVSVPSPGMAERTSVAPAASTAAAAPDTDAAEDGTEGWNTPRLSLRLSDAEMIALLAAQRGKDGKHRYSANAIHTLVGGSRADVLAQVRQLRADAPAVFRPLSDEQQRARAALGLDR